MKLTEEQKQNIIFLYQNHSAREVSIITGISMNRIYKLLNGFNIKKEQPHRKVDPQDIITDYQNGYIDVKFLARKYNCSVTSVNRYLRNIDRVKRVKREHKPNDKEREIISDLLRMSVTLENMSQIARRYNVSRQYVHKLKNKITKTC